MFHLPTTILKSVFLNGSKLNQTITSRRTFFGRMWYVGRYNDPMYRMDGKVCIVTGCNRGIGKETVRDFARRGATVYMACRDRAKVQKARDEIILETKNDKIYTCDLNLADLKSIRAFVHHYRTQENRLSILVNNAGVMMLTGPKKLTKDGFELQMGVNHLGTFLLTNLLLKDLKKSSPSRIIMLSGNAHKIGRVNVRNLNSDRLYNGLRAYANSKLCNILFANELSIKLERTGVTVNSVCPGMINSELSRYVQKDSIFQSVARGFMKVFYKTVWQAAQTQIYLAVEPSLENVTGRYFANCKEKKPSKKAFNRKVGLQLWIKSAQLTGLPEERKPERPQSTLWEKLQGKKKKGSRDRVKKDARGIHYDDSTHIRTYKDKDPKWPK